MGEDPHRGHVVARGGPAFEGCALRSCPESRDQHQRRRVGLKVGKDAREATDTFVKRHKGDVLLNYENEAILAKKTGEWTVPYKLPSPNILIEGPIAVVDKNVNKHGTRKVSEAFARFLYTPAAQKAFVTNGFRPVTAEGKAYARGKFQQVQTFTVANFGGWATVNKKFFGKGGLWDQIFSQSR